jgi:glucose-6-phosphate dehydrogenase assembly protein OpcA
MATQTIDIQIPDIEKELNRQWAVQKKEKDTKACLFTLIIYASSQKKIHYLQELINSILDKFPCRIIFIQAENESKTSYFRVNVSNIVSGQSSVRCDQIVIEASQDQLFRVPFLVIPHIVSDLPVYLLWGQNPFEERDLFPYFQKYARRVIFDSECADDIKSFCDEMLANLGVIKMDVMDINWALVSNWRDLLAEIFDTPEKLEQLYACKSIIINYNDPKTPVSQHPEIRALYLQGWLASTLKWKYQNIERFENSLIISYVGKIHPVIVALTPQQNPTLPPGAILSIEMTTTTGYSYGIYRKDNLPQVVLHVSSKNSCELPFTLALPNVHKGLVFMREIFFESLGEHYKETLKNISQLDFKFFRR